MPAPNPPVSDDPFLNNVERMEPQLWNGWSDTCSPADVSIAISLRRIADALEGGALADKLEDAIVRAIANGAGEAITNWKHSR